MTNKWLVLTGKLTLSVGWPLLVLLTCLQLLAFQPSYYDLQFSRYGIEAATGMDRDNLNHTMKEVMAYLKGEREDLVVYAVVNGEEKEVFGPREKEHMVDVKELFRLGFRLRNIAFAFVVVSFFLLIKTKFPRQSIGQALVLASTLPLCLGGLLGAFAAINFTGVFILFHELLFANDLWQLDPSREILIQMLPEGFFRDTALLTLIMAAVVFSLSLLSGKLLTGFRALKSRKLR